MERITVCATQVVDEEMRDAWKLCPRMARQQAVASCELIYVEGTDIFESLTDDSYILDLIKS
jgi:hypothetical protein